MPVFVACFKWVVDEAYIRRDSSGGLDFSAVDYKIGEYDRNAIEEAVRLKETFGGQVIAVTAGTPDSSRGVKDALSRGADQAIFAGDPSFHALDPSQTACLLSEVVRKWIPSYDLILCGEGSSDQYFQQVGPRMAENLGIPCVSFARRITLKEKEVIVNRRSEDGTEIIAAPLPALVTVHPDINVPRIPGVKDTLMASKKPVTTIKADDLTPCEPRLKTLSFIAARMERTCERFGAEDSEISRFIDALRKRGIFE